MSADQGTRRTSTPADGAVRAWIDDEVDPVAAAELSDLLTRADGAHDADLADRFAGTLRFGTAGLRGPLRAGPNGMNRTVVRRAAAGVAAWLTARPDLGRVVVVGHDARHGSAEFARDSAAVFAAAGLDCRLLPGPLPTPVLAYAVQALDAAAGVMVTASHNPREDNGYKVYGADGIQIVSPADAEIEAAIRAVGPSRAIAMADTFERLDAGIADAYVDAVAALAGPPAAPLRIVHTALHGVGTAVVGRIFARAGFPALLTVPEQAEPDPDFPTLAFPNPEEPGALDLAFRTARAADADLVIANDPDADRCAVAVDVPGTGWQMLRGDELGALLADAVMTKRSMHNQNTGTYATTIVSCTLLGKMARRRGVGYAETLTGFKWIMRAAPDLVFGYEEALGYAVAPDLVRDKDGMSAALLVAELAASLAASGSSLLGRLDELSAEFGRHTTDQISVRVGDVALIGALMRRLRADPPTRLLGQDVGMHDRQPAADVVTLTWPTGRVVVRPSGTEPKLKAYLEVVVADGSRIEAERQMTRLRTEIRAVLGI